MNQDIFAVVLSLCRTSLGGANPATRKQVERLMKQLEKEGLTEQAAGVAKLLAAESRAASLQPSKLTLSASFAGTEHLSRTTAAPTDRETGAALAEIIFPTADDSRFPLFDPDLKAASESIVHEWQNHEKLRKADILPPSTCLIYGLPGTGKTCLALSIAAMLQLPVVLARLDGLISSFLGTTGRNIGNLFSFSNRYACVLLLDEFDAIAKVRDDPHEVGEIKRVVNAILQNIDQRRGSGLTIAITNHEALLDSAVWRRFDLRIAVPSPSFEVRKRIAERYFPAELRDETFMHFIAWLSDGLTGADIEVMAKNVHRHQVLNPGASLLLSLRHFSITQAGRNGTFYGNVLALPLEEMALKMSKNSELKFSQRQIAKVLGISQSKVSRRFERR